ncbi:hypothetical protein TNCV_1223711 [Trichonephila clavipes]|nr:hypothetical protein TNCV_1223711 [Trichonephila clavipes]
MANVMFTDESRFSLNTDDSRRTFIWRKPGSRYLTSNVREIDNYGGEGQRGLQTYRECLGRYGEGNCNSQSLSEKWRGKPLSSRKWKQHCLTSGTNCYTQELINCLISSVTSRCEDCIARTRATAQNTKVTSKEVVPPDNFETVAYQGKITELKRADWSMCQICTGLLRIVMMHRLWLGWFLQKKNVADLSVICATNDVNTHEMLYTPKSSRDLTSLALRLFCSMSKTSLVIPNQSASPQTYHLMRTGYN